MHADTEILNAQSDRARALGSRLLEECAGDIFPCDALLNRQSKALCRKFASH